MTAGLLSLKLLIRDACSLKDKRRVIKSLKDRLHHHYNVSVAEVADNNFRQQAVIGIAAVGNDSRFIAEVLSNILKFVGSIPQIEIIDSQQEYFSQSNWSFQRGE